MAIYDSFSEDRRRGSRKTPEVNPIGELIAKKYENWGYLNARGTWSKDRIDQFYFDSKNGRTREVNISASGNLYLIICDEKKWFCVVDCSD